MKPASLPYKHVFVFLVALLCTGFSSWVQAQSASISIDGITKKRVDKYTKTFKVRKRYSTEPLGEVQASVTLKSKTIQKAKSDKDGNYHIAFDVQPNQNYYLTFTKNGYYPKRFKFNTNGISAKKKVEFKAWDFHLYKRVIGLPDSIFLLPTQFYYDSERGYMTYDEEVNLPLALAQEEMYLNYLRNLNETDFELNDIDQESEVVANTHHQQEENEMDTEEQESDPKAVPKIHLLDMKKLLKDLKVSDSDSLIEKTQTELSGEWQQLEIAKMKATTEEDKTRISEAETLLREKERQIRQAQDEIENARKKLELTEMENRSKNTLLILASFVILLVLTLLFVLFKNNKERQNTNILLSQKNKEILDSIKYAQRLQNAILPPESIVKANLKESFVLYMPKDIVSGDFYWVENIGSKTLFAVVDCTGHGVPGAFMSIVAFNALNQAVNEYKLQSPGDILTQVNQSISNTLHQSQNRDVEDGMDISLCLWDTESGQLQYAGANHPLYLVRNHELIIIKGDKFSIGSQKASGQIFANHSVEVQNDDLIYIFSDGYADQFGGDKGRKMMQKSFKEALLAFHTHNINEQPALLEKHFHEWKGTHEQVDDICVMGIKIKA